MSRIIDDDPWIVPSQCLRRHRPRKVIGVCAAFPGEIPAEIALNVFDHSRPWIDPETGEPGDEGVALAGSITFEPRSDVHPSAVENPRRYFDRPRI